MPHLVSVPSGYRIIIRLRKDGTLEVSIEPIISA
jgi:hypothetical protein